MDADLRNKYRSHPHKLLHVHTQGVVAGVERRTPSKIAKIATVFHDLGKLNFNFQPKLDGVKVDGYSNHAYLSALAWLCFMRENPELVRNLIGDDPAHVYSVAAIVARHHRHLPNMQKGFFKAEEGEKLKAFLLNLEADRLPISEYLQYEIPHKSFTVCQPQESLDVFINKLPLRFQTLHIADPLDFFLETQFAFACLIESDKRDAGDNKEFNKERFGASLKANFSSWLAGELEKFQETPAANPVRARLNTLRTRMRHDAVEAIKPKLKQGERVFTLSAPTGAGKTMMLLSLAAEILRHNSDLSVIYALPFLSITEQVEAVCKAVFRNDENAVLRIDSKSENRRIDNLQKKIDASPSDESLRALLQESFSENTFDHPFIVTTFVQLFEALVSNRNSTLLRLPNFARTIFLIDEIQALPPRLYTFFTALLDEFCRKFNSYAIISTATMPYLEMPRKDYLPDDEKPHLLFKSYRRPSELLEGNDYYKCEEFNRYRVTWIEREDFRIEDLADEIEHQSNSSLVILNTIDDTKKLYELLSERINEEHFADGYVLLNTHFTLNDRRTKLEYCKQRLNEGKHIVLISTQLIEAGVDIDFPTLYRDVCPLPNLIQSAGRCNRNGELSEGDVFLFELKKESGKSSASLIYRDEGKDFLTFCKTHIVGNISEANMFDVQKQFFEYVGNNLKIGLHKQFGGELNMVKCVNDASFEALGAFQLIDDEYFGDEFRYYIPRDFYDSELEKLSELATVPRGKRSYAEAKERELQIESQMRRMSGNIVAIRISKHSQLSPPAHDGDEIMGIRKLADSDDYSSAFGIQINGAGGLII